MANTALNRTGVLLATNKSGGALTQGATVILSSGTALAFTTTTTASYEDDHVFVIIEPNGIANDAVGLIANVGYVPKINLSGSASLGDYVFTHTVAGQAVRSGTKAAGAFGQVLGTGTSPAAILFGGLPKQTDATASSAAAPQGYLAGLEVDAAGGNDDWTVQPGACRDVANAADMTRTTAAGALTGDLGTTGANALDTGAKANNTWYAVFLIRKSSDGTIATLASTSATAPTMPSGYDQKRHIGWIRTDGSGNCRQQFTTRGGSNSRYVRWRIDTAASGGQVLNAYNVPNAFTDVDCSAYVPSTSRSIDANIGVGGVAATYSLIRWREKGVTNENIQIESHPNSAGLVPIKHVLLPLDATQIGQIISAAAINENLTLAVAGYYDNLLPPFV